MRSKQGHCIRTETLETTANILIGKYVVGLALMNPLCRRSPTDAKGRDQRAVCFAAQSARRPVPLSMAPVPLLKPRARHELAWRGAAGAAGFPPRLRRR